MLPMIRYSKQKINYGDNEKFGSFQDLGERAGINRKSM